MSELTPGQLVGEYRVERKLGEGTFGKVYAAVHPVIGKQAAIKVLNPEFAAQPEMVSRFVSEARAVNQIRHRNIIDIFSFGTLEDGQHYFVMELLEGMTLEHHLQQNGPLPLERALPIFDGIARALEAAHKQGIAHRDLKPENVFIHIDEEGQTFVKLLDFGIAKLLGNASVGHRTATGMPIGTPLYMSPEQCKGSDVDHRTDIYAFGIIIHEVLTGLRPFQGESVMEVMMAHLSDDPPPVSSVRPGLPPGIDGPIQRMMAKDRDGRPQDVRGALQALVEAAQAGGMARGAMRAPSSGGQAVLATNSFANQVGGAFQATGDFATQQSLPIDASASMSGGGAPHGYPPPNTQAGMPADAHARVQLQPNTLQSEAYYAPGATAPGGSSMGAMTAPRAPGRHGGWWALLGMIVLALVGGGVYFATMEDDPSVTRSDEDEERVEDDDASEDEDERAPDDAVTITTAPIPVGATFDAKHETVIKATFTAQGIQANATYTETQERAFEVLAADDHRIQRAQVRYQRYGSVFEATVGSQPQPVQTETEVVAHRTFDITCDGSSTLQATDGGVQVTAELQSKLKEELMHNFAVRPNLFPKPLSPGDEMHPPGRVMIELMRSTAGGEGITFKDSTLTFKRLKAVAGRRVAIFDVKTTMVEKDAEADLTAPLQGTVEFDVATGWPVSATAHGPFKGFLIDSGTRIPATGAVVVRTEGRINEP